MTGLWARGAGWAERSAAGIGGLLLTASVAAHEYWLDPLDATPDAGGLLLVDIRNGEDFSGSSFPYDPRRMQRVELVGPNEVIDVEGRLGDFPAFRIPVGNAGPYMLLVETGAQPLVYDTLADFTTFLDYHGVSGILERHVERGLAETEIRERYYRYAKTLVYAGERTEGVEEHSSAVFASLGTRLEIVAGNDPANDVAIDLILLFDGYPLADSQAEIFLRKADGTVSRRIGRSDSDGKLAFAIDEPGKYLVNAVRVVEPSVTTTEEATGDAPHRAEESKSAESRQPALAPQWESHWASLTFEKS